MKITWEYLAGFTDGEGTIRVPSTSKSITANYSLVQSGDEGFRVLMDVKALFAEHGISSTLVYSPRHKTNPLVKSTKSMWHLGVYRREHVVYILEKLLPFLRIKRVQTQDILRFLRISPPLNKGLAWKTLCSENGDRQRLTSEQLIENRKRRTRKYYAANKSKIRAYQKKWKRARIDG